MHYQYQAVCRRLHIVGNPARSARFNFFVVCDDSGTGAALAPTAAAGTGTEAGVGAEAGAGVEAEEAAGTGATMTGTMTAVAAEEGAGTEAGAAAEAETGAMTTGTETVGGTAAIVIERGTGATGVTGVFVVCGRAA